ncbi:MAG: dihydrofolate reductase [Planctomycetota bacterium]
MSSPQISAVVAVTPNGVIGRDGDMPWRLSGDLRRFKSLTMGGVLLMGRKTFESIGRPLPGRRTIVVTRQSDWRSEGVDVAHSPEEAVAAIDQQRGFVVGGAEIYHALLPKCDVIYLTRVWSSVAGDTRLEMDWGEFEVREQRRIPAGPRDDVPTEFVILRRRK